MDGCQFTVHPHTSDHRSTRTLPKKKNSREQSRRENETQRTCERGGGEGRTIRCLNKTPKNFGEGVCLFPVSDTRTDKDTGTPYTCDLSQGHTLTATRRQRGIPSTADVKSIPHVRHRRTTWLHSSPFFLMGIDTCMASVGRHQGSEPSPAVVNLRLKRGQRTRRGVWWDIHE